MPYALSRYGKPRGKHKLGLTRQMRRCLDYIRGYIQDHGASPTLQEIARKMGFRHRSAAFKVVAALHDRGELDSGLRKPRSIVLADPHNLFSINLPPDMLEDVKLLSLIGRCSIEDVIIEAARDGIAAYREKMSRRKVTGDGLGRRLPD